MRLANTVPLLYMHPITLRPSRNPDTSSLTVNWHAYACTLIFKRYFLPCMLYLSAHVHFLQNVTPSTLFIISLSVTVGARLLPLYAQCATRFCSLPAPKPPQLDTQIGNHSGPRRSCGYQRTIGTKQLNPTTAMNIEPSQPTARAHCIAIDGSHRPVLWHSLDGVCRGDVWRINFKMMQLKANIIIVRYQMLTYNARLSDLTELEDPT